MHGDCRCLVSLYHVSISQENPQFILWALHPRNLLPTSYPRQVCVDLVNVRICLFSVHRGVEVGVSTYTPRPTKLSKSQLRPSLSSLVQKNWTPWSKLRPVAKSHRSSSAPPLLLSRLLLLSYESLGGGLRTLPSKQRTI